MANKTTANWTQGNSDTPREKRVVHTRKNTTFAVWQSMLVDELARLMAVNLKPTPLSALHAWEGDETPSSYAYILWKREQRAEDRRLNPQHFCNSFFD